MRYASQLFFTGFLLALTVGLAGCDTTGAKSKQMARIAKDWSLVIRASQVIPVYPLTEDILPGDAFLVRTTIADQVKEYEAKGFLPLDQLLFRLEPGNYASFYLSAYGIGGATNIPYNWKFPTNSSDTNAILQAPRAAFPSYSFTIKRGAGINLALPVEGVPVALNLLGARAAHGDITISDAYTFGIDINSLLADVTQWATNHQAVLKSLGPSEGGTNFLRIVNRVYWVGSVNISIFNDDSFSGAGSGGVSKPVNLPDINTTNTAGNYSNALSSLSDAIASAATPGGTLKVAAASSRSISMNETFPRPLAIGYLGFDLPILDDGELGPPVPTRAALNGAHLIPAGDIFGSDTNTVKIRAWLKDSSHRAELRTWLDSMGEYRGVGIPNVLDARKFSALRAMIVEHFNIS